MKMILRLCMLAFLALPMVTQAQLKATEAIPLMTRGINLGNTMEAPSEGAWNNPTIKEYYFDDLKAAGFNTIRIPMNWWNHTSKTAPYTIDPAWLNRVEQVVDWGLARGLFIVMNTHHEEELFNNFDAYLPMYVSIWTQIAERMRTKSDRLFLELLNEPHGKPTVANLNAFNTRVVAAIRRSNPTRIIVYSGNQWANSYNLINKDLVNPNPGDQYLMGYYHSYDPIGFGLSGNGTFGSDADKQGVWNKMKSVADWTKSSGIPAYLGEFGAISSGDLNSRFRYYATNVDYAITHNLPFQVWDNGGDYQVYIRGSRKFNEIKDILTKFSPQSPTNFTAANQGGVVLNWVNRVSGAASISIQRKLTTADAYTTIATVAANSTTFTDVTAPAGTYFYRVVTNMSATTQFVGYPQQITSTGTPSFALSLSVTNASVCVGNAANLTASPVISSGTITKVELFEGTTLLATDLTAPYTFTVPNPSLGNHSYTARATSSAGTVANSNAAQVTVTAGTAITPYVLVGGGLWANDSKANVCLNTLVTFGPQPLVETGWSWTGPNGFTAQTREIAINVNDLSKTGNYIARFDDGTGCVATLAFNITGTNTPAPAVTSPVNYTVNDQASALVATGTSLAWYTTSVGGIALAGPPVPSTAAAGTTSYYVSQTVNGCESARSKIDVTVSAPAGNQSPTVAISAPLANATFTTPANVTISANAADADGSIVSVDFYAGTTLLGSDATAPYTFVWANAPLGRYNLTAVATDNQGAVTTSAVVAVTISAPVNVPPTVSLSAPANNATFTAPAVVALAATASDADGSITKVEFFNGTTLLATDNLAPFTFSWAVSVAGTYTLTAKATDNSGAVTTSLPITVVVNPVVPKGDIIGPDCGANNTTLSFSLNPTLRANATAYNWWYTGSSASTSIVAGAPFSATIQTGGYFSAGQVCVGVNMSVSPYYKQYCKSLTKCATGREENTDQNDAFVSQTSVYPNPFAQEFVVRAAKTIEKVAVYNELGNEVYRSQSLGQTTQHTITGTFTSGLYVVKISYTDGSQEMKNIVKLD